MPVLIDSETQGNKVAHNISRKLLHLNNVMMAVVDFTHGPELLPEEPHSHPHEQISYIAEGEVFAFIGKKKFHLKKGDIFSVPAGIPHCIQMLTPNVRIIDSFSPVREEFLTQS
jgi:quercetin dioxygenase-like cupin family protein